MSQVTADIMIPLYGNGSFSPLSAGDIALLSSSDPYFSSSPMSLYIFAVLSMLAVLLVLPSLAWHLKSRNLPASCIACWVLYLNVCDLANTLLWPTDDITSWYPGYIYCDLATKLNLGSVLGVIAAVICILRSLAQALDVDNMRVSNSPADKRRKLYVESAFCIGLPLVPMVLDLFVQSARYAVHGVGGCWPVATTGWPTIPLIYTAPCILAVVGTAYAVLVTVRVTRYRKGFAQVLGASSHGMSVARFFRLYALAGLTALVYLPMQTYELYWNIASAPVTAFDFREVHDPEGWATVYMVPAWGVVPLESWSYLALAAALVLTIGLGSDANAFYRDGLILLGLGQIFPSLKNSQDRARLSAGLTPEPPASQTTSLRTSLGAGKGAAKAKWYGVLLAPSARLVFGARGVLPKISSRASASSVAPLVGASSFNMSGLESGSLTPGSAPPPYESPAEPSKSASTDASTGSGSRSGEAAWYTAVNSEERTWRAMEAGLGL